MVSTIVLVIIDLLTGDCGLIYNYIHQVWSVGIHELYSRAPAEYAADISYVHLLLTDQLRHTVWRSGTVPSLPPSRRRRRLSNRRLFLPRWINVLECEGRLGDQYPQPCLAVKWRQTYVMQLCREMVNTHVT